MADLTLYNISNEFTYLCDLIDRDVLSPEEQVELETMIAKKIENSSEEIIKFYKSNQAYVDSLKSEIADLQARKKKAENREAVIKERLTENMKRMGIPRIDTTIGSMVVPNRVDLSINVVDIEKVPKEFIKEKTEVSVDKTAVKKYFKETGEIVAGTEVVENQGKVMFK